MFGRSVDKARIDELTRRVSSLEETVAALCREAGLPEPEPPGVRVSDTVRSLVAEDKPVAAIRQLREETGLDLRSAKLVVDQVQAQRP